MTVTSPMQPIDVSARPFGLPAEIVVTLPTPPGTNNLFFNSARAGRCKSEKYRAWITEAGWTIQQARQKPIAGPVCVFLKIQENAARDQDGYWKPILDLLVRHQLITDDRCKIVRETHAVWSTAILGVQVTVRACV